MKKLNFMRITLTVVTLSSMGTFFIVFKLLHLQNQNLRTKVVNDFHLAKRMIRVDKDCQDRLKVLEEEVALLKIDEL